LPSLEDTLTYLKGIFFVFEELYRVVPSCFAQPLAVANTALVKLYSLLEQTECFRDVAFLEKKRFSTETKQFLSEYFRCGLSFLSQKSFGQCYSFVCRWGHLAYARRVFAAIEHHWNAIATPSPTTARTGKGGEQREGEGEGEDGTQQFLELTYAFIPLLTFPDKAVRDFGSSVFSSLITNTFKGTGDLKKVRRHLILATQKRKNITNEFISFFCNCLSAVFADAKGELKVKGEQLVFAMDFFLTQLSYAQSSLSHHRSFALHDIMVFMKSNALIELFIAYAIKLKRLHVREGNFAEAGCAVCAHADLYPWDKRILKEIKIKGEEFPSVPAYLRKIALYEEAIGLFKEAKEYEKIISIHESIAKAALEKLFDANYAIETLRKEVSVLSLSCGERVMFSFYRVGFFGQRFPPDLRNKQFIYKTTLAERFATFSQKIQGQFKDSVILSTTDTPGASVTESNTFSLLITAVQISSELEVKRNLLRARPHNSNTFLYAKPKKIEGVVSDNEFLCTGLVHLFFITEDTLPSSTMRTKVIKTIINEYSPLEHAILAINEKNREVNDVIMSVRKGAAINPLTMALNGIISAGVNGGTEMYKVC
jgi:hypothetical protein